MVITLTDVSMGKNNYWLIFQAYIGELDMNKKYKLEFCGSELNDGIGINEEIHEQLRLSMVKDFGFAPYKLEEAKETLKKHCSYTFRKNFGKADVS